MRAIGLGMALMLSGAQASACALDYQLGGGFAKGRNAWAERCQYIDSATRMMLDAVDSYVVFANAIYPAAATREAAPCLADAPVQGGACGAFKMADPCAEDSVHVGQWYDKSLRALHRRVWAAKCGYPQGPDGQYPVFNEMWDPTVGEHSQASNVNTDGNWLFNPALLITPCVGGLTVARHCSY